MLCPAHTLHGMEKVHIGRAKQLMRRWHPLTFSTSINWFHWKCPIKRFCHEYPIILLQVSNDSVERVQWFWCYYFTTNIRWFCYRYTMIQIQILNKTTISSRWYFFNCLMILLQIFEVSDVNIQWLWYKYPLEIANESLASIQWFCCFKYPMTLLWLCDGAAKISNGSETIMRWFC